MRADSAIFKALLEDSDRRDFLCRNVPFCNRCGSRQVQLMQMEPAKWKCRMCNFKFDYEPQK